MDIHKIFNDFTVGSDGFVCAIETHCPGFGISRAEIARIATRSRNAAEFEDVWDKQDWWKDVD